MAVNVYEMVTNKIIEKLEQGTIPWRKPWTGQAMAVNWNTQKPYRGINTMLLEPGEYATFKQISEAGGKVKKGAKSEIVVFWKFLEKENEEGEKENIPFLKYYRVFNIATQVEGLKSKRGEVETYTHDKMEECENIIKGYMDKPSFSFKNDGAYYIPSLDNLNMPPMKHFPKLEEYYSTFFHELIHSTGHKSRLNRDGIIGITHFGSETYSKEELVAELGAQMLCSIAGIHNEPVIDNSASYIKSWLGKLKDDKTLLVKAGGQAQKAADYILGIKFEG
ncbi:zincin-like metallopeptidase domain-containing protein [Metabacillus fastidiosus]|nr:zincin-like metallopeptidase domain-containing protein [Metabacillus fastidiosus]